MLRCEKMNLIKLYLSKDNARKCIEELGETEMIHFKDLNNEIKNDKLLYINEIKHIEKLQNRLQTLNKCIQDVELSEMKNSDLEIVEEQVTKFYYRMAQLNNIKKETKTKMMKLKEDLELVDFMKNFVLEISGDSSKLKFDFITGIVDRNKKFLIKKILCQALRGNLVIKNKDIEKYQKTIFLIFTHGDENLERMKKIFVSLGGRVLDIEKYNDPQKNSLALTSVISQIDCVEKHNDEAMKNEIQKISSLYLTWKYYIEKEYKIYKSLNKFNFDKDRDLLVGDAWVRTDDLNRLKRMSESSENSDWNFAFEKIEICEDVPPSSFKLCKYVETFQDLVNVYGLPSYGEINPGIFMIFLFPMLFGVMFGDVFHGTLLVLISMYFIKHAKKLKKKFKSIEMLIDGRYVMFLCGLCSILFGFLYSDFSAFSINLFGSRIANRTNDFDIYPFGIDPAWHEAANNMEFTNSVKMKLSLVIGFLHMGLGICISIFNCLYFKNTVDLLCVVIPQAIAYVAFFGYLIFLILFKWLTIDLNVRNPSLISTYVLMFTSPFEIKDQIYPGQMFVQLILLCLIFLSFPWMLLVKPIYLIKKNRVKNKEYTDLWMNQGIHMVEFGIGLISNSSSYLRLWAVSLAHAQLTKVLVENTIKQDSILLQAALLPLFIAGTLTLLIGLEGLGACLHSLRLNWIEFNSKFYGGTGYKFEPLSFKEINED